MGTIPIGRLGDDAQDHEGYVEAFMRDGSFASGSSREIDAQKTGKLTAGCACGWRAERVWNNDADTPGGFPSEDLEDTIMAAWSDHVDDVAGGQPVPDPAAMAHQIAADVRALANAIRPGTVYPVYPSHLYRALSGLRDALDEMPGFFDNALTALNRHQDDGRLYSDHGTLDADMATLVSELDQARSGLVSVDRPLEAAVDVARNLGYRDDDEEE